jgi:O-antigen/teichoic acid export membrane protein
MVGQVALALAIVMPVIYFLNMQLRGIIATDARREFTFAQYLGLRAICAFLGLGINVGIAYFGPFDRSTALIIAAVALTKTFDFISDMFYGLAQQVERMDRIAISLVLQGVLQLCSLGLIVWTTKSLALALLATAAVSAFITFTYDVRTATLSHEQDSALCGVWERAEWLLSSVRREVTPRVVARLAWIGLPMGVVLGLNSVISSVPRYIIVEELGQHELGVFAGMFYFIVAGQQIVGALGDSSSPRLALWFASNDYKKFFAMLARLVAITLVLGLIGVVFALTAGPRFLTLVYNSDYAGHGEAFTWLLASSGPLHLASILGVAVTAMRRFHIQVPFRVIHVCLVFVFSAWLIPRHGLIGAGQAMCASALVSVVMMLILLGLCSSAWLKVQKASTLGRGKKESQV